MDKKSARIRRATRARRKLQELGATRLVVHLSLIHILMCIRDSGKADRVGFRFEDGKKVRFFKSNSETIK